MSKNRPSPGPKERLKEAQQKSGESPAAVQDVTDPGDSTARNYRYQYSYGVALLAAAARDASPYAAVWCEHHEDFLAERTDGKYDGYQIKTSKPELGAWRLTDPELIKTIGRFVDLLAEFEAHIHELFFVSNTQCESVTDESHDDVLRSRCPLLFLEHVRKCPDPSAIQPPFAAAFSALQAHCGCDAQALFSVLRRMGFILGPSRDAFDAVLSNEHLSKLDGFKALNSQQLDGCRDALVAAVHRASSLHVTDPRRHLRPMGKGETPDPVLLAKRIAKDVVPTVLPQVTKAPALSFPGAPTIKVGTPRSGAVLEQKLEHGGLTDEVEYMKTRERAAEYSLIEDAIRRPERFPELLQQIEQLVLGECSESHLRARQKGGTYGPAMLIEVQDRLRNLEKDRALELGHHRYECLIGVAALLTSECRVWWSPRFPVQEKTS